MLLITYWLLLLHDWLMKNNTKMRLIVMILIFVSLSFSFNKESEQDFEERLNKYQLKLDKPDNFKEIQIREDTELNYHYALKHNTKDFEIRFLVNNINEKLDLPEDERSYSLFTNIVLNASGQILPNIPEIKVLEPYLAQKDYNADWLANSMFVTNSNFAKGFDYCSVIGIRKNDVSEAYMFFLFNDKNDAVQIMPKVATCLKFL